MKRRIVFLSIPIAVLAAVVLVGCATKRTAAVGAGADETRVRQTLAQVERQINQSDLGFVNVFAKDAVIIAPSAPDIAGIDAIRALYAGAMEKTIMNVHFSTEEVAVSGDLAYEHGTYTLRVTDRASGRMLEDVKNKHLHIMKRQPDGSWKTWRMMVNSAGPEPNQKTNPK